MRTNYQLKSGGYVSAFLYLRSVLDRSLEDYFEIFVQVYDDRFSRLHGFWRPYVEQVIYRYLDCGDLHQDFARIKCKDCGHEYLLSFSCKRRHFCRLSHHKRGVEFDDGYHPFHRQSSLYTEPLATYFVGGICEELGKFASELALAGIESSRFFPLAF